MAKYSEEFKYSIITKIIPPQNQVANEILRKLRLSEEMLYQW